MASIKYKDNGEYKDIVVKVGDTLPIGTEVDYEGAEVPNGWEEVDDPNEYSTTEQVIGKWIDGKPLYRKVVSMGTLPSSQGVIASTDTYTNVKRLYGYAYGSNNVVLPLPYCDYQTIDASVSIIINSSNKIEIGVGRNRSAYTSYAIVEYTKTTD